MAAAAERASSAWAQGSLKIASPLAVLLVWEAASRLGLANALVLPPPSLVFASLVESLLHGTLLFDIAVSCARLVAGFLAGTLLGLAVGMAMVARRTVGDVLDVLVALVYPIPKVAILPLLLIWFGTGEATRMIVIATGAFFPVVVNLYAAAKEVDPVLIRAARNLGAGNRQVLRQVVLPAILPAFYAGAILGASLALVLLVYAEMTAAESGVGYFTFTAASLFEPEQAFAGVFTLGVMGWLWHRLIVAAQAWHCPWQRRGR